VDDLLDFTAEEKTLGNGGERPARGQGHPAHDLLLSGRARGAEKVKAVLDDRGFAGEPDELVAWPGGGRLDEARASPSATPTSPADLLASSLAYRDALERFRFILARDH